MNNKNYFEKSYSISDEIVKKFAEVSGDKNPLHLDEQYARNTIFKGRIAHGILIASFISSIIGNDFPGAGTIYVSQNLNFKKPIKIGDEITIKIFIVKKFEKGRIELETRVVNQYNETVITGNSIVIPPNDFKVDI